MKMKRVCFIYLKRLVMSLVRRQESMFVQEWIPAFALMTAVYLRFHKANETHPNETDQLDHVITLLALLLDPLGRQPRHFHNNEIAAIRRALILTYEAYEWEELLTDQTVTPTLTIFCQKLRLTAQQAQTDSLFIAGSETRPISSGRFMADSLELDGRHRRELLHGNRFEVTTLHAAGQDKAHVLVVDDLAVDFMFPTHSVKQELALDNPSAGSGQASRIFIGLNPVHGDNQMRLDVQSLVNLHPFFQPEHLLAWAGMESELFLDSIRTGCACLFPATAITSSPPRSATGMCRRVALRLTPITPPPGSTITIG